MRLHERFEWDAGKAKANLAKHGVAFEDAAAALGDEFADRFHLERYDEAHSADEDRFTTLASDPADRSIVYCIAWTERGDRRGSVTRIVSARVANRAERRLYAQAIH